MHQKERLLSFFELIVYQTKRSEYKLNQREIEWWKVEWSSFLDIHFVELDCLYLIYILLRQL